MKNTTKIRVSDKQVECILKQKNKIHYYDIYDNKNNFTIGKLKLQTHTFINSSNTKKFQELYLGNFKWIDADENYYKVDFSMQSVFDLEKSYDLDTFNIALDVYCMSTLVSSMSTSINRSSNDSYDVLTYNEGSKIQRNFVKENYTLNDHFAEEAVIMYYEKKKGKKFEYINLDGDKNLTELSNFKYINNFHNKKNKEFHVYEIDLNLAESTYEKLIVTSDNSFSIDNFQCGHYIAKLNRKRDYKRLMN